MEFERNALLASIDEVLAELKAALLAGSNELAVEASAMIARLPTSPADGWDDVPRETFRDILEAQAALRAGELAEAERRLEAARETIGGPSS